MTTREGWLALILLTGCGDEGPSDDTSAIEGIWQVTAVDGVSLPAPTPSGTEVLRGSFTFFRGDQGTAGSGMRYCTDNGSGAFARGEPTRWRVTSDDVVLVTYPDHGGAAPVEDTATVSGGEMELVADATAALLGRTVWTLEKLSDDPTAEPPTTCP